MGLSPEIGGGHFALLAEGEQVLRHGEQGRGKGQGQGGVQHGAHQRHDKGKGKGGSMQKPWGKGTSMGHPVWGQDAKDVRVRLVCGDCGYWSYADIAGDLCPACKVGTWKNKDKVEEEKPRQHAQGDRQGQGEAAKDSKLENFEMEVLKKYLHRMPGFKDVDLQNFYDTQKGLDKKQQEEDKEKQKTKGKRLGQARGELDRAQATYKKTDKEMQELRQKKQKHIKDTEAAAKAAALKLDNIDQELIEVETKHLQAEKDMEEKMAKHKKVQQEPEDEEKPKEEKTRAKNDVEMPQQGQGGTPPPPPPPSGAGKGRLPRRGRSGSPGSSIPRSPNSRSRSRHAHPPAQTVPKEQDIFNKLSENCRGAGSKELLEKLKAKLQEEEEAAKVAEAEEKERAAAAEKAKEEERAAAQAEEEEKEAKRRRGERGSVLPGTTVEQDREALQEAERTAKDEAKAATEAAARGAVRV